MSFKKAKILILESKSKSNALLGYKDKSLLFKRPYSKEYTDEELEKSESSYFHLYFITDEKPNKVEDWFIVKLCNDKNEEYLSLEQVGTIFDGWINNSFKVNTRHIDNCYKVIATTNDNINININLGKERWVAPTNSLYDQVYTRLSPFPKPSKSFIDKYIEMYNKNTPITDVLIQYEDKGEEGWNGSNADGEPIWIENMQLKVNSNNEITIKRCKDSWNREEVIELFNKYQYDVAQWVLKMEDNLENKPIPTEWIKQNL